MLKEYVDYILKKTNKPIDFFTIIDKVNRLMVKDDPTFSGLSSDEKMIVKNIINEGVKTSEYIQKNSERYISILKTSFRKGKFQGKRNGEGKVFVSTKDGKTVEEYSISKNNVNGAIDDDIVLIDINARKKSPKVVKVLERNLEAIMGEVYCIGKSYFVRPIDKKKQNLTIALEGEAIEGERVAVNLEHQVEDNFYVGKITRVFNHKDDPDEDVLWEAFKLGIDDQFSKESIEQVKNIPMSVLDTDKIGRSDLTDWEIFTIDGEDTKDIDDAVSCKMLDNGNYLLGVHIADVSHYVLKDSPLDRDAFRKGTSYYLVGKVIPMLMHELSNGICSLNPYVERLALSCIMEINSKGDVVNYNIMPTVIKSCLKMSYTKVNEILKNGVVDPLYENHAKTLLILNKLALILRRKRLKYGAVEFNRPELKVNLDENGKINKFSIRKQDLGENLIEECMLIANETVDKHLSNLGLPCLHRIHDIPNEERLTDFYRLLEAVSYPFYSYGPKDCVYNPKALQELCEHIKQTGRLSNVLSGELIRCMSRAKYSPNNIGHAGLAKENYCHFTSPIRRYPDLTIHRILKDCYFDSLNASKNAKKWQEQLSDIGEQSSKMERIADKAEAETLALKCSEYMMDHIGEEYEGTIVSIGHHGFHVQLDNMIEGKVRLRNLEGEYFYNPETFTYVALDKGENYYIGDRVLVKVVDANKENKIIDFKVIKKIDENYIKNSSSSNQYAKFKEKERRANKDFDNF